MEASEDSTAVQVCVELSGAMPSSAVTLTLDPAPGSATGKLLQDLSGAFLGVKSGGGGGTVLVHAHHGP